ncbi:MAG: hypothetical protein ACXW3Y_13845 [Rhodoplanes sp.]|jgi:hypothetical protein
MLKKVFLAAAMSLVMAGATMIAAPAPAQAFSGCHKAAKEMYPHDRKARKAYKKHCKAVHKAYKKAHKKHRLFKKAA